MFRLKTVLKRTAYKYLVQPADRLLQTLQQEELPGLALRGWHCLGARIRLLVIASLMLLPAILALLFIKSYAVNVPYWDDWEFVVILDKFRAGHLSFQDLFAQHNEHRLFFPMLVMLLVATITGYNTIVLCYFSWLLLCLITCVFFRVHTRALGTKEAALAAFVPISWLVFNLRQWHNLVWGYQVPYMIVVLFSVLAMYLLATTAKLRWRFGAAAISGVICTFSLANGLAVWPIGLIAILWIRKLQPKELRHPYLKMACIWCLLGIVACVGFFAGYHAQGTESASELRYNLEHPLTTFARLVAPLGTLMIDMYVAIGTGLLLLLSYIVIGWHIIWQSKAKFPMVLSLSLIIFTIVSAVLLALGRGTSYIPVTLVSRYATLSILGVIGLYLAVISLGVKHVHLKHVLLGFLVAVIVIGVGVSYKDAINEGRNWRSARNQDAYYISTVTIQSDETLAKLTPYPPPEVLRERAEFLAKYRLSVFSEPSLQPQQLVATEGSTLLSVDLINGQWVTEENATIIVNVGQEETISILGWAVDQKVGRAAGGVFVNVDGQMDIPALYGLDRPDVAQAFQNDRYRSSGFLASFATSVLGEGQHVLSLKIVTSDKKGYYEPGAGVLIEVK